MVLSALKHSKKIKTKKAFSLVELIVSLAIMGIIMTIFFNMLALSAKVTYKALARSRVREELSDISNSISRDIRNSDYLIDCGQTQNASGLSCELVTGGKQIKWSVCDTNRICRNEFDSDANIYNTTFESSTNIIVKIFTFEKGFSNDEGAINIKNNVLFTIVGSYKTDSMGVNNIIQQSTISTRNYEL